MKQPLSKIKSKAYLIIVGAFSIGVVTGSLLMNLVVANSTPLKKPTVLDELSTEIKLSPEQKNKVDEIYKDSRQRGKEILKSVQPQMDELRAQTKSKIKSLLDPQQQSGYDTWCAKKEAERKKNEERK